MKKNRVIPILVLKEGDIVQSYEFKRYKRVGNALKAVERLSQWDADEMIYLDITTNSSKIPARDDLNSTHLPERIKLVEEIAKRSSMPFTFGGGLKTIKDIELTITAGADKVSLNSLFFQDKLVVRNAVRNLGSQAIVASIDYKVIENRRYVWNPISRKLTEIELQPWLDQLLDLGVGEILLTSIDRDGSKQGYDLETISEVSSSIQVPLIANGGVGKWDDFKEGIMAGAEAVAAANIFHFTDQSVYQARDYLYNKKMNVRKPSLSQFM
jgi:cyclase